MAVESNTETAREQFEAPFAETELVASPVRARDEPVAPEAREPAAVVAEPQSWPVAIKHVALAPGPAFEANRLVGSPNLRHRATRRRASLGEQLRSSSRPSRLPTGHRRSPRSMQFLRISCR